MHRPSKLKVLAHKYDLLYICKLLKRKKNSNEFNVVYPCIKWLQINQLYENSVLRRMFVWLYQTVICVYSELFLGNYFVHHQLVELNGWIFCLHAEQQERLKLIHDKFKEEVNQHLLDCRSIQEELESYNLELKGTADWQSMWTFTIISLYPYLSACLTVLW